MEQKVAQLPLSDQLWAWFEANKKLVAWGGGIAVVLGIGISYYVWRQGQQGIEEGEALTRVLTPANIGTNRVDSGTVLKLATELAGSSAGARALLHAASSLFLEGKYAEAQTQFQRFTREYADSPFIAQAMLGVAASLDAQAKTDEALRAYQDVINRRATDITLAQARFGLARIYESQNKLEQARSLYEEIARADVNSSLGNEAGIRAEELKAKLPAPPAPPAAVITPTLSVPATANPAPTLINKP